MNIAPAHLEHWLRDRYFTTELDISSSGVEPYSFAELRALAEIESAELDALLFRDSRSLGADDLRAAISARWGSADPEQVMVTHGSSEALFLLMQALLQPGDEVIVVDPCYHALSEIAVALGCQVRRWQLQLSEQFTPDLAALKRLISPRTRLVALNFPHNPTGATLTATQQTELVQLVAESGAYLIWDAAFAELIYDAAPLPSPTRWYRRAITVGTLSKGYGLPGLRVGWCIAEPELLARCVHLRDYVTLHLSPLVELVARRAIQHADRLLGPRLEQARRNRDLLATWISQHSETLAWSLPRGGVSAFVRLRAIADVEGWCAELASVDRVLLVPGSCFNHPGYVRLGFGGPTAELEQGLARVSHRLRADRVALADCLAG